MKPKPNITEKDEQERRRRVQQQERALLAMEDEKSQDSGNFIFDILSYSIRLGV
jgi:hypothetical protein